MDFLTTTINWYWLPDMDSSLTEFSQWILCLFGQKGRGDGEENRIAFSKFLPISFVSQIYLFTSFTSICIYVKIATGLKLEYTITQKYRHADDWQRIPCTEVNPPITGTRNCYDEILFRNNFDCYGNQRWLTLYSCYVRIIKKQTC